LPLKEQRENKGYLPVAKWATDQRN